MSVRTLDEGIAELKQRHFRRAVEIFKGLLTAGEPLTPELAVPLAHALKGIQCVDEAKQCLQDALRFYPESKRLHAVLGDMHRDAKEYAKAIDGYTASALALTDDLPSREHHDFIKDNLAVCYEAVGNLRQAESIFRDLVSRNPHTYRYAIHLYDNLVSQHRNSDAAEFAKIVKFFYGVKHLNWDTLEKVNYEDLRTKKIVIYGIESQYGLDRLASELHAHLRNKGLAVYCFIDDEIATEQFEGKPVYSIYDLLLEDESALFILSLYHAGSDASRHSFQTIPIIMLGIQEGEFLGCMDQMNSGEPTIVSFDLLIGSNQRQNSLWDVHIPGFVVFGDIRNEAVVKIVILGGSTSDAVISRYFHQSACGIKPWAELLHEYLKGNSIPAVIYCGAMAGHHSSMELLKFIRDVIPINPDVVISYTGVNDLWERELLFNGYGQDLFITKAREVLGNTNMFWGFPERYSNGLINKKSAAQCWIDNIRMMHSISQEFSFSYVPILQSLVGEGDVQEHLFLDRFHGGPLQSWFEHQPERAETLKNAIAPYPYVLDYTNIFKGHGGDHYYDHCHVTTKGNRIIAQKVYEDLSAMGLLERKSR